ncbi:aromatic amino acid hydroxylase [Cytobacillus horneckiae]|uniref:aromatic amino acid hydroxylase n=1 Tax=Cytobacillus horneckiae TaxID=549687 RepID=UPI0020407ADE|nr:aromatic amino acid hydroxylase [Cytobacillus horneckiae]MCM3180300.1 aromatic amino acid hydroxylase [Cytobacillus horneckiae]
MKTVIQEPFIPQHLRPFVAEQHYNLYSPIDHAVWRYVMRQNHHFLKGVAHEAFTDGLTSSGINIDTIPEVEEMRNRLSSIGWSAVIVDGLIPGTGFFDFQAHGILPIATDIRKKTNIEYTPAPDIIHEAAGHAPILFDELYSEFVKIIGNIGANAFASKEEHKIFEATRELSIVMEKDTSTEEDIRLAKEKLKKAQQLITGISEAELISRIFWWTVEFGLIGDVNNPNIFGAGLLSSVGESKHSLSDKVKKRRFTIEDAISTEYDVTSMQNQLFVAESFEQLIKDVTAFSQKMAFRKGGTEGIEKAIQSGQLAHLEFDSGIQLSGVFSEVMKDDNGEAIFVKTSGPSALSIQNNEIVGHGVSTHHDGFSAPIGNLTGGLSLENKTEQELKALGIEFNKIAQFTFESGIEVAGHVTDFVFNHDKVVLITLEECLVKYNEQILFDTSWGTYDLIVGTKVLSARPTVADFANFHGEATLEEVETVEAPPLNSLEQIYADVRTILNQKMPSIHEIELLTDRILNEFPDEWLVQLELLEIAVKQQLIPLKSKLSKQLAHTSETHIQSNLIQNGLKVILEK